MAAQLEELKQLKQSWDDDRADARNTYFAKIEGRKPEQGEWLISVRMDARTAINWVLEHKMLAPVVAALVFTALLILSVRLIEIFKTSSPTSPANKGAHNPFDARKHIFLNGERIGQRRLPGHGGATLGYPKPPRGAPGPEVDGEETSTSITVNYEATEPPVNNILEHGGFEVHHNNKDTDQATIRERDRASPEDHADQDEMGNGPESTIGKMAKMEEGANQDMDGDGDGNEDARMHDMRKVQEEFGGDYTPSYHPDKDQHEDMGPADKTGDDDGG